MMIGLCEVLIEVGDVILEKSEDFSRVDYGAI